MMQMQFEWDDNKEKPISPNMVLILAPQHLFSRTKTE